MNGASIAGVLAQYLEVLADLNRTTDPSERRRLIAQARTLTCEFNARCRIHKEAWTLRKGLDPFSCLDLLLDGFIPQAVGTRLNMRSSEGFQPRTNPEETGTAEVEHLTRARQFETVKQAKKKRPRNSKWPTHHKALP